jgi:hypothetical protein
MDVVLNFSILQGRNDLIFSGLATGTGGFVIGMLASHLEHHQRAPLIGIQSDKAGSPQPCLPMPWKRGRSKASHIQKINIATRPTRQQASGNNLRHFRESSKCGLHFSY